MAALWLWLALFGLGAFHGLNPAMGWLFAVCLGLQERRRKAVLAALPPIAVGHALSVGLVIALIAILRTSLNPKTVKYSAATILILYGIYRLVRARHPRWVGMRVGFRDLTSWSFLMASAHGAGLMLVPLFLATTSPDNHTATGHHHQAAGTFHPHFAFSNAPGVVAAAVLVHTLGHLLTAGAVALLFYETLGWAMLKKAWFNIDFTWALALIGTGIIVALISM
jgi:hypothetical protein